MPHNNLDQEPAEGSREIIDHELARQDKKQQDKQRDAKGKPTETKQ
jgi:hypothetical protein